MTTTRTAIVLAAVVGLISSACLSSRSLFPRDTLRVAIPASGGGSLEIAEGPRVDVPSGALSADSVAELEYVREVPGANSGSYRVIGEPFEFRMSQGDTFSAPVYLTIPYDPQALPPGRAEANVFAVVLLEGQWTRVYGEVDEQRDVIVAETLHNGIWSWAIDTVDNLMADMRGFLGEVGSRPLALEQARQVEAERYVEMLLRWQECELVVGDLQEAEGAFAESLPDMIPEAIIFYLLPHEAAALGLTGSAALLYDGTRAVAEWAGQFELAITVGRIAGYDVLGVRCLVRWAEAHSRLREAQAVVAALEHPQQVSFYPDFARSLSEFLALQMAIQSGAGGPILDWSVSASGEFVANITLSTSTPAPTPTVPATPTPAEAYLEVLRDARCRYGPGTYYPITHYFEPGVRARILGRLEDGSWYYIQRPDDPRASRNCWIAASLVDAGGAASVEAIVPIMTPPPTPTPSGGDVRIRLAWGGTADLDLHVIDPAGFEINFGSLHAPSGGSLDHDANYPCSGAGGSPAETVTWAGTAPAGPYTVIVDYFTECNAEGPVSYSLIVWVDGGVALDQAGNVGPGAAATYSFSR